MSETLTVAVPPVIIGGVLGMAIYNISMAIFQNFMVSTFLLLVVVIIFPMLYVDRSPRCVYCFGRIASSAQFCVHCGRIQPEP